MNRHAKEALALVIGWAVVVSVMVFVPQLAAEFVTAFEEVTE